MAKLAEYQLTNEILEYLRTKLNLPEHITNISIHLSKDDLILVDCTFYPTKKENE